MPPRNAGAGPSKGNTKIRFVMLEVDSTDGNLSEIAHAITNAVRPSLAVAKMQGQAGALTAGPIRERTELSEPTEVGSVEDESVMEESSSGNGAEPERTSAPRAPRKYPMPTYLHDLDLEGGSVSFKEFAQQKPTKKHSKRYLVIATWFKEYGGKEAITIDHVYTCYKTVGWNTNIADWDLAFRQLVKRDWMRRVKSGEYAITPIGEADVNAISI